MAPFWILAFSKMTLYTSYISISTIRHSFWFLLCICFCCFLTHLLEIFCSYCKFICSQHARFCSSKYNCTSCIKINKMTEYLRYSKIFLNCLLSDWITWYFGSQICGLHLQTYIRKWLFLKWISHIHLSFSQHFLNTCHGDESGMNFVFKGLRI